MSCEISVIYPGLEDQIIKLEIPETRRSFGVVSFGSDPSVCFGSAPGMGGFVLDRWEAKEYGILPRHCALLWAGGKFRLEFDRHAGVYLNGSETSARSFCNPFEDGAEFTMRLGMPEQKRGGGSHGIAPVFKIRRNDQAHQKTGLLTSLALRFNLFRKVAMMPFLVRLPALVMFVTVFGAMLATLSYFQSQRINEALIRGDIPQDIGLDLAPSVASIGIVCDEDPNRQFHPYGTAWLYEHAHSSKNTSKWLVTNFHVVHQMELQECASGTGQKSRVAIFPGVSGDKALRVTLDDTPRMHPLYNEFEAYGSVIEKRVEGQQSVANIYDIAAFKLTGGNAAEISPNRTFLKLGAPPRSLLTSAMDSPHDTSSFSTTADFTQNIEPGRPVLILSYPTENQPFLADGVSADPFQFRTTLQSKSNAMSRTIPGESSNRTPALYSFSAKSAGGMSGSPVIVLNQNGDPFVSGIVFSASFVRGQATTSGGSPLRLASGDGTYALDTTSLTSITNWPAMTENATSSSAPSDDQIEKIKTVWQSWQNDQAPLDEKRQQFASINAEHRICAASRTLKLSRQTKVQGSSDVRGETRKPLKFQFSDQAQNTLFMIESRSKNDDEQLLQLAISKHPHGKRQTSQVTGLNQASFLKAGSAPPYEIQISAAGPHKARLVLTVLEAVNAGQPCPNREAWNG